MRCRFAFMLGSGVVLLGTLAACYTGSNVDGTAFGAESKLANEPGSRTSTTTTGGIAPQGTGEMPCEVEAVLVKYCTSCHGSPLKGGAQNRMLTYADLEAPSKADPKVTVAEISVDRMKDPRSPMPPGDLPDTADTKIFETWVLEGMPRTGCATSTGTLPTTPSPYDTPNMCSSNQRWLLGDRLKTLMNPGGACNDCHNRKSKGPIYAAAGTVYPSAHEPDNCIGVSSGASVVLTEPSGRTITLALNASGNFTYTGEITKPFRATVVANGKTRAMSALVDDGDGDCNSCHTEGGLKNAPGRIMMP